MKTLTRYLPKLAIGAVSLAAFCYGPVAQLPNYHDFADQTQTFGIPHAADVISNLGFALVALWGWWRMALSNGQAALGKAWPGYRLFLIGLFLTAFGSAWYHLAPDNARLVWDRLPIALACAGLLAGVWGETHRRNSDCMSWYLGAFGVFSVAWWYASEISSPGDLRLYLLLQGAPFILVPLWQWLYGSARGDRWGFGLALLLYAAAKFAELYDHQIGHALGGLTGHTLKHLLATAAAGVIVFCLTRRQGRVRPSAVKMPAGRVGYVAGHANR